MLHHGHGQGQPVDCRERRLRGVLVPRGPATIPSPPRKEWVNPVRRVPGEMADDLRDRVHPPAAPPRQPQEAAQGLPECRDPTRQ